METCKAAVITGFNDPTELRDVQMPDLEPTGMLVEVEAATLCGTDVHIWHDAANPKMLPYIPGHETAGRIVAINGERFDVHGNALKEGDRIVSAYRFCGHCFYCSVANQPSLCDDSIRFGRGRADQPPYLLGGCAEYHYIPPGTAIIPIPDEVTSPQAASAACALRTVMHGFERLGPIYPHDTVVVQGSGPVGLYASAVARDRGAGRVLVIGAPRVRLDVAEAWGRGRDAGYRRRARREGPARVGDGAHRRTRRGRRHPVRLFRGHPGGAGLPAAGRALPLPSEAEAGRCPSTASASR